MNSRTNTMTDNSVQKWDNNVNIKKFYENKGIAEALKTFSEKGGLASCCDLEAIKSYIEPAEKVLEIGAGYGRVIEYLQANYPMTKITGVEKSAVLFKSLQEKFDHLQNIRLYNKGIQDCFFSEEFDLALWMWSGISDFFKTEQKKAIERIYAALKPNGMLILDVFPYNLMPANANFAQQHEYVIEIQGGILRGYLPSPSEMKEYSQLVGFTNFSHFAYETSTRRTRDMYLLKK